MCVAVGEQSGYSWVSKMSLGINVQTPASHSQLQRETKDCWIKRCRLKLFWEVFNK